MSRANELLEKLYIERQQLDQEIEGLNDKIKQFKGDRVQIVKLIDRLNK